MHPPYRLRSTRQRGQRIPEDLLFRRTLTLDMWN
jgi:hypothetical protein